MGAKNKVIAGDYMGYEISAMFGTVILTRLGAGGVAIDKNTVDCYDLITEDKRKSATSGVARGAIGVALLGPVGALAGLSAKNKGTYTVAISFKDGKNSLVEMDDKVYKAFLKKVF